MSCETMEKLVNKKVCLDLVGTDGNAFAVLGKFSAEAMKQGWEQNEIDVVLAQCQQGDYDHLLATILLYSEPKEEDSSAEPENEE